MNLTGRKKHMFRDKEINERFKAKGSYLHGLAWVGDALVRVDFQNRPLARVRMSKKERRRQRA